MAERICAYVLLAFGLGVLIHAPIARLFGWTRFSKWWGGGTVTLVGNLAVGTFLLCIGLVAVFRAPVWIAPAILAWVVGYVSQRRANLRHAAEESQLRATNSAKYPGVFDSPPPENLNATSDEEFDLFDAEACSYLGIATKRDLQAILDRFSDLAEQGSNDIYLLHESLGMLPQGSISHQVTGLLENAFEERDFLVLRWIPRSKRATGA